MRIDCFNIYFFNGVEGELG